MYKIVVADDEEELRRAIVRNINWNELGFELVGEAENGAEALELVEKTEPDLLLTDIRMPFISGLELARQVREVRPYTQIAFLSGYDDFSYAQEAIRYNIISYMLKPISMSELTENLRVIKEKIDVFFRDFAETRRNDADLSEFLLPLVLDSTQTDDTREREERLLNEAASLGFIGKERENIRFNVISLNFRDSGGVNRTAYSHVHAVDGILKKYMRARTFYCGDKTVSVLAATKGTFDKYLHIAFDEIIQSTERILGQVCFIGAGRTTERMTHLYRSCSDSVKAMHSLDGERESGVSYISDIELMKEERSAGSTDICDHAIEYIEKNYQDADLSLVKASTDIGASPNYLSSLIKKRTGRSFIDYLTFKRMETAKELLTNTSMKVREISEACGYNDQHYFSYCFKKYEGISPNMLRQRTPEEA